MTPKPSNPKAATEPLTANTVLSADNGDVIIADETGLRMRLSDRVIEDIAARLGAMGFQPGIDADQSSLTNAAQLKAVHVTHDDLDRLVGETLDSWDIKKRGDLVAFMAALPGRQGPRGFVKHQAGGGILADTSGPLRLILAIGGPRAALATLKKAQYPYHIVAPADDIGAVGRDGEGRAEKTAFLEGLREMTHEALVAQALLYHAQNTQARLPLYLARAETDGSATASDMAAGSAVNNLAAAAENAIYAAQALDKSVKLDAVFVDFCLEDVTSSPSDYRDGVLELLESITQKLGKVNYPAPKYFAFFECGGHDLVNRSILEGQWELSWNAASHNLTIVAPSYMLELDQNTRLTDRGRKVKAAISAEALFAETSGLNWRTPVLHLAEKDGASIRVVAQLDGDLVLDESDPFGAGDNFGFSLDGVNKGIKITEVKIAPDDKKSLMLSLNKPLAGANPTLLYAAHGVASTGPFPANSGALRDGFSPAMHHDLSDEDLAVVRRWALPACLPIT